MTLPSEALFSVRVVVDPTEEAPDSSCPTVRYPSCEPGYDGLDAEMIERSESVFPPAPESKPDPWAEALPLVSLVSTAKWLELLGAS